MALTLSDLVGASNGPTASSTQLPTLLTVGDSIVWGQGLHPSHRFRELTRRRLAEEGDPAIELSMARSGASACSIGPDSTVSLADHTADVRANIPGTLDPLYSPKDYTREVPSSKLATHKQIEVAASVLRDTDATAPDQVKWIILDGGINDVTLKTLLSPLAPLEEGYFIAGWQALILDRTKEIQPEIEETLRSAVSNFPSATIVVTGYYPVISLYSAAIATKLKSVGLMWGVTSAVLATPFGVDAMATASDAWQAASNKILRRAINTVRNENPNRRLLFARSNIEGRHSLFGSQSWLWGYGNSSPVTPSTIDEWDKWFIDASPEDEVPAERAERCNAFGQNFACRLASLGHPNVAGAEDYARAIIESLEDEGLISSDLGSCSLARRRRKKWCQEKADEWAYRCTATDAKIGKKCSEAVDKGVNASKGLFGKAGNQMKAAGSNMKDAAGCFDLSDSSSARTAADQFSKAGDRLVAAGERLQDALECWDQTALDIQECNDIAASALVRCYQEYDQTITNSCNNIRCNSYENCSGRYGRWDPRRYACRVARAACVTFWALAKAGCIAFAVTRLGACLLLVGTQLGICLAGVVLTNFICTTAETSKAAGNALVAGAHAAAGIAVGMAIPAETFGCAAGNVGKAGANFGAGILLGVAGVATLFWTGVGALGCALGRWGINKGCRLGRWFGDKTCRTVATVVDAGCWMVQGLRFAVGMKKTKGTPD